MFHDQKLLQDLYSLPPVKQAEVLDFIQFLKQKQLKQESNDLTQQHRLELARELLLKTPESLDPAELALWDEVVNNPDEPLRFAEPNLGDDY